MTRFWQNFFRMISNLNLDPKIRCLVLYEDAGWNATRISHHLDKPIRTIRDWMKKIDEGIDIFQVGFGRGRKPSIPSSKKTNIIRTTRSKPLKSSTRKLSNSYGVSVGSAFNILTEKGYTYSSVGKKRLWMKLKKMKEFYTVKICWKEKRSL